MNELNETDTEKSKRYFFPTKKLKYLFIFNVLIWCILSLILVTNAFENFTFSIALGTEIAKLIILILWGTFFYLLIQVLVETKFTLFFKRLDRELKYAEKKHKKEIVFREDQIFNWAPEELNRLIFTLNNNNVKLEKELYTIIDKLQSACEERDDKLIFKIKNELKTHTKAGN